MGEHNKTYEGPKPQAFALPPQAKHPTDAQLEAYCLGHEDCEIVAEVERHLLICPRCQDRVDDLSTYADAMTKALTVAGRQDFPYRSCASN
jgi:anti-sigma factor RsiW